MGLRMCGTSGKEFMQSLPEKEVISMTLQVDIRPLVHSLTDTLDLVGVDEVQHGKRVAFMARSCAKVMDWSEKRLDRLYHASLLHDCGVSSTEVHRKLVSELDWNESEEHCIRGEELLRRCRVFEGLPQIIRYHHTHWEDMPDFPDRETALFSNLIYLADRVDALICQNLRTDILMARHDICDTIAKYRGTFFEKTLTDSFLHAAESEIFWLMLDPRHMTRYVMEMEKGAMPVAADSETVLEMAEVFADIVDAKSSFTLAHSKGVGRLARYLGSLLGLSEKNLEMLEVAGLLHDLGKLYIPDGILEKPGPLTEEERSIMLRHSFESYQILSRISGFEKIARWAAFHHEELSGGGYPFRKSREGLPTEARIIAAADVFQALAQKRPYRDSMPIDRIVSIMEEMAANGKLDPDLVAMVKADAQKCLEVIS